MQWLEVAAKANGFKAAGNAQADVKANAKTNKESTVATTDLEPMAKLIASRPQISVPSYFAAALGRAIRGRTLFGERLRETGIRHSDPTADRADQAHKHFINVLRGVGDILQPRMGKETASTFEQSISSDSISEITNRFQGLEITEPSEAFLSAPDIKIERPPDDVAKVDIQFKSWKNDYDEALFVWVIHQWELLRLRKSIAKLWQRHRQRESRFGCGGRRPKYCSCHFPQH